MAVAAPQPREAAPVGGAAQVEGSATRRGGAARLVRPVGAVPLPVAGEGAGDAEWGGAAPRAPPAEELVRGAGAGGCGGAGERGEMGENRRVSGGGWRETRDERVQTHT